MGKFTISMVIFNSFLYVYQVDMLETDTRPAFCTAAVARRASSWASSSAGWPNHGGPLLGKQVDHPKMVDNGCLILW